MPRVPSHVTGQVQGQGGFSRQWDGAKLLDMVRDTTFEALARTQARAQHYWDTEEWVPSRHPYMTGDEESIKANGYFIVRPNEHGTARLIVGSGSEHTIYDELGTSRQPAHHAILNTVERVAYTISDDLRAVARRRRVS